MYDHKLITFIKVADTGSFLNAAKDLYLSVNAVRKQILLLESQLEVPLFERTSRGSHLTPEGKIIYNAAQEIIRIADSARNEAIAGRKTSLRTIRVGTSILYRPDKIMSVLQNAAEEMKNVSVSLVPFSDKDNGFEKQIYSLGENVDILYGFFPVHGLPRYCNILPTGKEPLYNIMSKKHRLAAKEYLELSDMGPEDTLMIPQLCHTNYIPRNCEIIEAVCKARIEYLESYDITAFQRCERENAILVVPESWISLNPSLAAFPSKIEGSDNCIIRGICYPLYEKKIITAFVEIVKGMLT